MGVSGNTISYTIPMMFETHLITHKDRNVSRLFWFGLSAFLITLPVPAYRNPCATIRHGGLVSDRRQAARTNIVRRLRRRSNVKERSISKRRSVTTGTKAVRQRTHRRVPQGSRQRRRSVKEGSRSPDDPQPAAFDRTRAPTLRDCAPRACRSTSSPMGLRAGSLRRLPTAAERPARFGTPLLRGSLNGFPDPPEMASPGRSMNGRHYGYADALL